MSCSSSYLIFLLQLSNFLGYLTFCMSSYIFCVCNVCILLNRLFLSINDLYIGTINPLAPGARRNFHPAQAKWGRVADRPHAFSLRPNSYIWIASSELFAAGNAFPREFTLFLSLRLRPEVY